MPIPPLITGSGSDQFGLVTHPNIRKYRLIRYTFKEEQWTVQTVERAGITLLNQLKVFGKAEDFFPVQFTPSELQTFDRVKLESLCGTKTTDAVLIELSFDDTDHEFTAPAPTLFLSGNET